MWLTTLSSRALAASQSAYAVVLSLPEPMNCRKATRQPRLPMGLLRWAMPPLLKFEKPPPRTWSPLAQWAMGLTAGLSLGLSLVTMVMPLLPARAAAAPMSEVAATAAVVRSPCLRMSPCLLEVECHEARKIVQSAARSFAPILPRVDAPPSLKSRPLVQTFNWLFRPIKFMDRARREHGDVFGVTFVGFQTPMYMISDPEAVRALYRGRIDSLPPGRTLTLEPILGPQSLLLLEGQEHLARRKVMLPPFHGERMRAYESTIEEITTAEIDSWPIGEAFPIHPRMQAVTLEVIMRAVFGVGDPARLDRLRVLLRGLLADTAGPRLQLRVLLARRLGRGDPLAELQRRQEEIDKLLNEEIAERRDDPGLAEREDILSLLVGARFEEGDRMSDAEIRDQLMTLLLAGHETTATGLAWTFDLLLRNPGKLARLREELADGEDDTYLRAVISESLRLRPVVPLAGRRLSSELQVNGWTLPEGADVTPSIWLTHTREDIYPNPLEFRPERFLDNPPDTYGWIPFGGGVRRCLGAAFAEFEMRIVLRETVSRCELRGARRRTQGISRRNVTFSPKNGTPVIVDSRLPAALRQPAAPAAVS